MRCIFFVFANQYIDQYTHSQEHFISYITMLHYIQGALQRESDTTYIIHDTRGIQVLYTGTQTSGARWLHPHIDDTNKTIRYMAFDTHDQYQLFMSLTKVSGIGTKTALLITQLGTAELQRIITELDTKALSALPGIGAKTAQRIIIQMKDKLTTSEMQAVTATTSDHTKTIIKHLTSLGFDKQAIQTRLRDYPDPITAENTNDVIKWFVKG
jgi:Holliday junction DNA helicase RuvA